MITNARIDQELRPRGVDWITSLGSQTIRKLMNDGPLQISLFDERNSAEIIHPDFPGERLIACRNPLLAADRARTREELLEVTERNLEKVRGRVHRERRPLRGETEIGVAVAEVLCGSTFPSFKGREAEANRICVAAPARRSEVGERRVVWRKRTDGWLSRPEFRNPHG